MEKEPLAYTFISSWTIAKMYGALPTATDPLESYGGCLGLKVLTE